MLRFRRGGCRHKLPGSLEVSGGSWALRVSSSAGMQTGPDERSGCLIAIYTLFAIGALVLLVGGASIYFFLQSEQGRQILDAAEKGAAWMAAAVAAPGTSELRDAGCEVAMVHSAGAALDVIVPLLPDREQQQEFREQLEARAGDVDLDALPLVFCAAPQFTLSPPGCAELAVVYGDAVEFPAETFAVVVAQQGRQGLVCQGLYTPAGILIDPLDELETPSDPARDQAHDPVPDLGV